MLGDEYKLMTHTLRNNTDRAINHTKLTATPQEDHFQSHLTETVVERDRVRHVLLYGYKTLPPKLN